MNKYIEKLKKLVKKASDKRYSWKILAGVVIFLVFVLLVVYFNSEINYRDEKIEDLERYSKRLKEDLVGGKYWFPKDADDKSDDGDTNISNTQGGDKDAKKEDPIELEIEFYSVPEQVYGISLYENLPNQNNGDPDEGAKFYKAGKVTGFDNENNANSIGIEKGYEYYLAVYSEDRPVDNYIPAYLRFLKSTDPQKEMIYIVERGYSIHGLPISEGYVFDRTDQVASNVFYPDKSYEYDTDKDYRKVYKSESDNLYEFVYLKGVSFTTFKKGSFEKVDSIGENDIYIDRNNSNGSSYMRSVDGFTYVLRYVPQIVESTAFDSSPIPEITWNDGKKNEGVYDYISIGGCFNNELEIANVSEEELEVVGKYSDGNNVYEKKDKNDEYRKKVYDEYKEFEMNVGNSVEEDDEEFFTYEEFLSYHPVFFWKDPFGRFIKFGSRDFIMTGGCAKPAIYMYPEEKSDIKVEVIPNGVLTYTVPRYGNGWDVTVGPDGTIINNADGERYDYLWWESRSHGANIPNEGFVVSRFELDSFFNEKLSKFGMNEKEITQFKDYWVDRMNKEQEDYFFVTFLFDEEVDQIAKLKFSREPDNLMRIFMIYEPLDGFRKVEGLEIPKHKRSGFTVVEWGGARKE